MLARLPLFLILTAVFLASASAEPGISDSVTVETNIVHKSENNPIGKERRAPDRIWSGVIMATNPEAPKPIPKELRPFEASLKRMFGYNQFVLVGTATEPIDEESEHWLLPAHGFSLDVTARHDAASESGGYFLHIQLFQAKRQLVTAETKLAPGSPLLIRGPECGKGELIIILRVQH